MTTKWSSKSKWTSKRTLSSGAAALICAAAMLVPATMAASPASAAPPFAVTTGTSQSLQTRQSNVQIQAIGNVNSSEPASFVVTTTALPAGQWVNLWYRAPGSSQQVSIGGATSAGDTTTIVANAVIPQGSYIFQASVGDWPNDYWSQDLYLDVPNVGTSISAPTSYMIKPGGHGYEISGTATGFAVGTPVSVDAGRKFTTTVGVNGEWSVFVPNGQAGPGLVTETATINPGQRDAVTASTQTDVHIYVGASSEVGARQSATEQLMGRDYLPANSG